MFNPEFYPTPDNVIQQMLSGLDLVGKVVLEPHAGRGDIVEALKKAGAIVIVCENNKDLAEIVKTKADKFLKYDFFEVSSIDVSHVDYIIMNPPFSNAVDHILHAWGILPGGCELITLINANTYERSYSYRTVKQEQLRGLVSDYGNYDNLGNVFSSADRKTNVDVGLIHLYKSGTGESEFEGYFDLDPQYEDISTEDGSIMEYNVIRDIVNRYVASVKMFDDVMKKADEINSMASLMSKNNRIRFGAYWSDSSSVSTSITRDVYKKELKKSAWETIFNKMKMDKYITKKVKEEINVFVEKQTKVPFTMNNVYKMIEVIVGTHGNRMGKVLVETFDGITKYYHDNRYYHEGWKTNSEYRVNKKFILPYMVEQGSNGKMRGAYRNDDIVEDLQKALCYLTGTNYEDCETYNSFMSNYQYITKDWGNNGHEYQKNVQMCRNFGIKYVWGFFEIIGYKKGTVHFRFLDDKVWERFNQEACKAKGFMLASKFTSDFRAKRTDLNKI